MLYSGDSYTLYVYIVCLYQPYIRLISNEIFFIFISFLLVCVIFMGDVFERMLIAGSYITIIIIIKIVL